MKRIKKIILTVIPIFSTPISIVACGQISKPIDDKQPSNKSADQPLEPSTQKTIDNAKNENTKKSGNNENNKLTDKSIDLSNDKTTIEFQNYLNQAKQLAEEVSQKYSLSKINNSTNVEELKKWRNELGDIYYEIGSSNSKRVEILKQLAIQLGSIENKNEREKIDEKIKFYKEINDQIFKYWSQVAQFWDKTWKRLNQLKKLN